MLNGQGEWTLDKILSVVLVIGLFLFWFYLEEVRTFLDYRSQTTTLSQKIDGPPWGIGEDELLKQLNRTESTDIDTNTVFEGHDTPGVSLTVNRGKIFDREVRKDYVIHPEHGLVKQILIFQLSTDANCREFLSRVISTLRSIFPPDGKIQTRGTRARERSFCQALAKGKAGRLVNWNHEDLNITAVTGMKYKKNLNVFIETDTFIRWQNSSKNWSVYASQRVLLVTP